MPSSGRTIIGCSNPLDFIDAAKSDSSEVLKSVLGCLGLGLIFEISIRATPSPNTTEDLFDSGFFCSDAEIMGLVVDRAGVVSGWATTTVGTTIEAPECAGSFCGLLIGISRPSPRPSFVIGTA